MCDCSTCTAKREAQKSLTHNSTYMPGIYDGESYGLILNRVVQALDEIKAARRIDTIAFSGSSGAAMAYSAAWATDLRLLHVRKPDHEAHFFGSVEGFTRPQNYVIVDDFMSSGRTLELIISEVMSFADKMRIAQPILRAVICYHAAERQDHRDFITKTLPRTKNWYFGSPMTLVDPDIAYYALNAGK